MRQTSSYRNAGSNSIILTSSQHCPNITEDITDEENIKSMKASILRAKCKEGCSPYDFRKFGKDLVKILKLASNEAISIGKLLK